MNTRLVVAAGFVLVLLCVVQPSHGQSGFLVKGDSLIYIYALETIEVHSRRAGNPSMVTDVSAERIRESNATTVADVLRFESGLSVTTGGKSETATRIRGFDARDVLVLVDGRPINPGYYGKVDLSMLPVDNIAAIRVVKGPASVAYGPNGMGGIINIVTKNGLEVPRTVVEGEFGDYRYRKVNVNHSRRLGRFNYWISGYDNFADGYRLSGDFVATSREGGGMRNLSGYHKSGLDGKLGFQSSPTSLFALSAGYHWAEKDVAPTLYTGDIPAYREFPYWRRLNSSLSGLWHPRPTLEIKATFFVDAQHDRLIDYSGPEMRDDQVAFDSRLENWTVGVNAGTRVTSWSKHCLHTGFGFKRDLMNKKPDLAEAWYSHHLFNATVFLEDRIHLWAKTEIVLGCSYNGFATDSDVYTDKLCPMVSVTQGLPEGIELYASFADAIRFPTIHQLYSTTSGNDSLEAEGADKYEVGLRRRFTLSSDTRYAALQVVFFHNELKNMIYRSSSGSRYKNIQDNRLQGWEIRVDWGWTDNLAGEIGYGHIDPSQSSSELLQEVAADKVQLRVTAQTGFGTRITYAYNFVDERTTFETDRLGLCLPAYHMHSANIQQDVTGHLRLRLGMDNITDVNYEEELGYPAPGRQIMGGFTIEL
ncbi:MAG: TonB-dependent receptor [candidate division Zixibacteria bacterium]|nr:TonB-dependent receptor [candidate division Zixibacteria bacterium]